MRKTLGQNERCGREQLTGNTMRTNQTRAQSKERERNRGREREKERHTHREPREACHCVSNSTCRKRAPGLGRGRTSERARLGPSTLPAFQYTPYVCVYFVPVCWKLDEKEKRLIERGEEREREVGTNTLNMGTRGKHNFYCGKKSQTDFSRYLVSVVLAFSSFGRSIKQNTLCIFQSDNNLKDSKFIRCSIFGLVSDSPVSSIKEQVGSKPFLGLLRSRLLWIRGTVSRPHRLMLIDNSFCLKL